MSAHDLSAVRDFFVEFDKVQLETWTFKLEPEVRRVAAIKQEMKLDGYTEGKAKDMVKVLARPSRPDEAWFAQHGARDVGARTLHAVQAVTVSGTAMALVYTNAFERNELGMNERFAVAEASGELQVVSHQTRCGECGGSGCGVCKQQGWRHAGGRELSKPAPTGEVTKLAAPEHADTRALYDALS
ncbi:MAG: hypothetical protein KDA24_08670 [Deltaproteobacteria bacterium]|nr:hypothetical protein [Deltaproteobacteria bacterium]